MERCGAELEMPGFRFHPTEEELLDFYLRRSVSGEKQSFSIIPTINLYLYDPWDLPALAKTGEKQWYFFVPRDRRQGNCGRPNRTTERGFWKATGSDRSVRSAADPRRLIGFRKTLVYYRGRAPRGIKTEWVMNEYRLPDFPNAVLKPSSRPLEDIVICKVYRKATTMKELEQRAAMEEESRVPAVTEAASNSSGHENFQKLNYGEVEKQIEEDEEVQIIEATEESSSAFLAPKTVIEFSAFRPPPEMPKLPEKLVSRQPANLPAIQVPNHGSFDWTQDPFVNQLRSPWLDQWSPFTPSCLISELN